MLSELVRMSHGVAQTDYVQGGGGNTSVKLENGLMAIKASGFRLSQMTETDGFAVVEVATLKDVTAQQGYKPLRPSVEVSFHALLKKYVLHTHPVYANLALCDKDGLAILQDIMKGHKYIIVPYINPGPELADAIKDSLQPDTQIIFMVNHGFVVTDDDPDVCLRLHEEINMKIAKAYGVTRQDFESFSKDLQKMLYPDQQVYLNLTEVQQEVLAAVMFIQSTLRAQGRQVQGMDEKAMDFIANWESEAYRKTIMN